MTLVTGLAAYDTTTPTGFHGEQRSEYSVRDGNFEDVAIATTVVTDHDGAFAVEEAGAVVPCDPLHRTALLSVQYIIGKGVVRWQSTAKLTQAFKSVQKKIAKKYGMKRAGAILAASTRKASKAAKKKNPRLKRVKG